LPVLYVVEDWNGNLGGLGYLRLFSIGGPVGAEVLTSIAFPASDETWDFAPRNSGDFAPQKNVQALVQTGNASIVSAVFRNGLLTVAHTVFLPAGGSAQRSAVQWWQLTGDGAVVQRGRLDDPSGQTFYAYPSVAPNRNNDLLIGYARFSTQQFPGAGYSYRAAGDPQGTLRDGAVLKEGEAYYSKTFGGGRNRWGDYSATTVDPVNDVDLWTIQEYAAPLEQSSPVSAWATWWGRVVPDSGEPVPLPIAGFDAPSGAISLQPVTFVDSSSGATQWFWNFGDGATSAARNPIHTFGSSGIFTVALTAVNQTGAVTATRSVTVAEPERLLPRPVGRTVPPTRKVAPRD
jgi:hypothetical protein